MIYISLFLSKLLYDSVTSHLKMPKHKMCASRHMDCRALSCLDQTQTSHFNAMQSYCNNPRCEAFAAKRPRLRHCCVLV